MHPLKSASRYATGEGISGSVGSVCLGLVLIPFGGYGIRAFWEMGEFVAVLGCALALVFGVLLVHGGFWGGTLFIRLGKSQAFISEPVIEPGNDFHFSFRQECRGNIRVNSLSFFLVFRERVDYSAAGETTSQDVDRLVQQVEVAGRTYSAGETIDHECTFRLPERKMGVRNCYTARKDAKIQTMWVLKVRLNINKAEDEFRGTLSRNNDIWKEYRGQVSGEPGHYGINTTLLPPVVEDKFDVFLVKCNFLTPIRHAKIIDPLFPHLDPSQLGELFDTVPSLLFERITWQQAQYVQTQLGEARVQVEIKPAI